MADPIVTDPDLSPIDVPLQTVYTRAAWDGTWVEREHFYCDFAEHAAAPSMSSAQLSYEYGEMMRTGETEFSVVDPLSIERHFIKVVFTPTTGPKTDDVIDDVSWYGVVLSEERLRHGSREKMIAPAEGEDLVATRVPSGTQIFHAVGMEWTLTRDPIVTTFNEWGGPVAGTWDPDVLLGRALTFNGGSGSGAITHENRGNREDGTYRFKLSPLHSGEDFGHDGVEWNGYWMILYLVFGPGIHANQWSQDPIPFEIKDGFTSAGLLSLKTIKPTVRVHGRTMYDLFSQIADTRHAVGWHIETDDDGMSLVLDSYAKDFVPIDLLAIWPNTNQKTLDFEDAGDISQCVTVTDAGRKFDQVVVIGARRGTVMTIDYTSDTLMQGWLGSAETAYKAGASAEGGYNGELEEWITANDRIRKSADYEQVYTHYVLPSDWDGLTSADEIALPELDIDTRAFTGRTDAWYQPGMRFATYLPLRRGWDYSTIPPTKNDTTITTQTELDDEFLRTFAVILTGGGVYEYVDKLSASANSEAEGDGGRTWSCTVNSMRNRPGLIINPGGMAHRISGTSWAAAPSAEPSDTPKDLDFRYMLATVFFENDSHVIERFPRYEIEGSTIVQTKVIDVGGAGHLDYVVPSTLVGIDDDGSLIESTAGGFVRDDREWMQGLARSAYEWYKESRQALTLSYQQLSGLFNVGDYITQIGEGATLQDVNTVITSVRWDFGASPSTTITTSFAELDLRT